MTDSTETEINFVDAPPLRPNIIKQTGLVEREARERILRQKGVTLWLTGLSGAGKTSIGFCLENMLIEHRHPCIVLDGDNLRHGLNADLGFTTVDRRENIRRAAFVANLMNDAGLIVIASFISPYEADRQLAEEIIGKHRWIEVYINTPLAICELRDVKGLYGRARQGEIKGMTGIDAPYEVPKNPDVTIATWQQSVSQSAEKLFDHLIQREYLG